MAKKKNAENLIVRESIFSALMQLMSNRAFDDITVTEITKRAGVSRMGYYRNFDDKKDILVAHLDELFEQYWGQIHDKPQNDFQAACLYFDYFRENRVFLMNLLDAGLTQMIFERHDFYLQTIFKDLYNDVIIDSKAEKYVIGFLSGGLLKVLIAWARDGMTESNEVMAEIVCELMKL